MESLCFFSWGGYSATKGERFFKILEEKCHVLLLIGFILSVSYFVLFWNYSKIAEWVKILNSLMIPAFVGVVYTIVIRGQIRYKKFYAESSLFIYLAHMFIGPYLVKIMLLMIPINNYTIFPAYLFAILITIGILMLTFAFLRNAPAWVQIPLFGKKY